jgi:hypothetical protein
MHTTLFKIENITKLHRMSRLRTCPDATLGCLEVALLMSGRPEILDLHTGCYGVRTAHTGVGWFNFLTSHDFKMQGQISN